MSNRDYDEEGGNEYDEGSQEEERVSSRGSGRQGFASMPKEKVKQIGSKGGKARARKIHEENESEEEISGRRGRSPVAKKSGGSGRQGFASMPKERVREIASKGGKARAASRSRSRSPSPGDREGGEEHRSKQRRGFAAMPKEKVREIAAKGGRSSHGGGGRRSRSPVERYEGGEEESGDYDEQVEEEEDRGRRGSGRQGFASMPKEKVREIAAKGGRSSHGGHPRSRSPAEKRHRYDIQSEEEEDVNFENQEEEPRRPKQRKGFATMPKERVKEIASKGGKAHKGTHIGVSSSSAY